MSVCLACAIAVSSLLACQPEATGPKTVRGLLIQVDSRSLTELERVTLRTDEGLILTFRVEGEAGITPGHAREHMVGAEPVTIHYREGPGGPIAVLITD